MDLRMFKTTICALVMALGMSGALVFADPAIKAEVSATSAKVGDQLTVKVNVTNNAGLHGLFFDLGYDASLFSFVDLKESKFSSSVNIRKADAGRMLYALSDPATSGAAGNHIVVSYTLTDPAGMTAVNDTLVELRFRIIGSPANGVSPRFSFRTAASGVYGLGQSILSGSTFVDSLAVYIDPKSNDYVQINAPLVNEVVYKDLVSFSATSTAGAGYTYDIKNTDSYYLSDPVSAVSGNVSNYQIPVVYGLNRLSIDLRDSHGALLATDTRTILRSDSDVFVKIVSPLDHALVNTDKVRFMIASPLSAVTVNGEPTVMMTEKYEGKNLFEAKLWLKKGFNVVTAEAIGPTGMKFRNSIAVYYQRDDSSFRFVSPTADSVIKVLESDPQLSGGSLRVRGEIGSKIRSDHSENTVSLKVDYTPDNPALKTRTLVRERPLSIIENDRSGVNSDAPYAFVNDFEIPVSDLANGTLEIVAYKNKSGTSCEAEIHRTVRLDTNKLAINLVQPNIYGTDILDTKQTIRTFNRGTDPVEGWHDVDLFTGGRLGIAPTDTVIKPIAAFAGSSVADLIEAADGTRYALVNASGSMRLYKRSADTAVWTKIGNDHTDKFGYALCESDNGILVGVSNLYSSENSGLYLLEGTSLTNIVLGEPIPHVQFIKNKDGLIYLYGNDYSYLYSFNGYSLEKSGVRYRVSDVRKTPCDNNLFLSQFVISQDAKTVLMLDKTGALSVYQNLNGTGFTEVTFDSAVLSSKARFSAIVGGEYTQGNYNAYLLVAKSSRVSAQVIMENKNTNRLIMASSLNGLEKANEALLGVAFRDNRFVFLSSHDNAGTLSYVVRKGTVLFDELNLEPVEETFADTRKLTPGSSNGYGLLASRDGSYTLGQSAGFAPSALYEFCHVYPATGSVSFVFRNPALDLEKPAFEQINGFSFLVEPAWIQSEDIKLSFSLHDAKNDSLICGTTGNAAVDGGRLTLRQFLSTPNPLYTVTHTYDVDSSMEEVRVDFLTPANARYLAFAFQFNPVGSSPRSISNLSVYKKTSVKLPKNGNSTLVLPIQGWVSDTTATEIKIKEQQVTLDKNGYFSYPYTIYTNNDSTNIQLQCRNAAGELATLDFTVDIFDSLNELNNVRLTSNSLPLTLIDPDNLATLSTNNPTLEVSAEFFGLSGLVAGYETYITETSGGVTTKKTIATGVFNLKYDSPILEKYQSKVSGYVSGRIENEAIPLRAGNQTVIIYVENPGGKRVTYQILNVSSDPSSLKDPEIIYNILESEQKIEILNDTDPLSPTQTAATVVLDRQLDLSVGETWIAPYSFTKSCLITGKIKSQYRFQDLKIKSTNPGVVFSNNTQEITVPVDVLNRFEVEVFVTVAENVDAAQYPLLFIPTLPFLEHLKTGILINAVKDYTDANIIPDLSLMSASNWSQSELNSFEKVLRVRIERHIPEGTRIALSVNFEKTISGLLVRENGSNVYRVVDNHVDQKLSGLKNGVNRIRWELLQNGTISSSISGRENMNDYLMEIQFPSLDSPTMVTFPVDSKNYYSTEAKVANNVLKLPELVVAKQASATVRVSLNGNLVSTDSSKTSYGVNLLLSPTLLLEGRNTVNVEGVEKNGAKSAFEYSFLYDTKAPELAIMDASYVKVGDQNNLSMFSVSVKEANLKKVELYQQKGGSISMVGSYYNYRLQDMGNQTYRVQWTDLEDFNPTIQPTPAEYLYVVAEDYAGNVMPSAHYSGISSLPVPEPFTIKPVNIAGLAYNGMPVFMQENEHWGPSGVAANDFDKRVKFYSSNITYLPFAVPAGADYTIQRSGKVTFSGQVSNLSAGKTLIVNSGTGVEFQPNKDNKLFVIPNGMKLSVTKPGSVNVPVSPMVRFTQSATTNEVSFSFWFRHEAEPFYAHDEGYKKILTVAQGSFVLDANTPGETLPYELYLAYRDPSSTVYGDETLTLFETFNSSDPTVGKPLLVLSDSRLVLDRGGKDGWNLITMSVDHRIGSNGEDRPIFRISVNQKEPVELDYALSTGFIEALPEAFGTQPPVVDYLAALSNSIFTAGSVYTFGNTNGSSFGNDHTTDLTAHNGHFSIAQPFYVNSLISNDDVIRLADSISASMNDPYKLPPAMHSVHYDFRKALPAGTVQSVGSGYLELRTYAAQPKDYFSATENADYRQASDATLTHGSLIASDFKPNRLKLVGNSLMFSDSTSAFTDKLQVTSGSGDLTDWLILTPNAGTSSGRYSFANNFGQHGVNNDRWFSVYGEVAAVNESTPVDATLVLVINDVEKRYPMTPGKFHYVFTNKNGSVPTKVVMYIEAKSALRLYKKMFFTEGDYRLSDDTFAGQNVSNARTKYLFQKSGTIEFWYKPMNANKEGFVDYDLTLMDGDLIKIFATGAAGQPVTYRASLYGGRNPALTGELKSTIVSNVPVREGWQHIQFSWDQRTADQVAYLYVNGQLAGSIEGKNVLPVSDTMNGLIPAGDNLYIGSNLSQVHFANGYIDDVKLDNVYSLSRYVSNKPIVVTYTDGFHNIDDPSPVLSIQANPAGISSSIGNLALVLTDENGHVVYQSKAGETIETNTLNIADYSAGAYKLAVSATVNGYRYGESFRFVKNDRPRFTLMDNTPLLVREELTDLHFDFAYNTVSLLEKDLERYVGLELVLSGVEGVQPFTRKYYVTQDFRDFTHNDKWLLFSPENGYVPAEYPVVNNLLSIQAPNVRTNDSIKWSYRPFYFSQNFAVATPPSGEPTLDCRKEIPLASLAIKKESMQILEDKYEYKLLVSLVTQGNALSRNLDEFSVSYTAKSKTTGATRSSAEDYKFNRTGDLYLFYDDMLKDMGYNDFDCKVTLKYKGAYVTSQDLVLKNVMIVRGSTMQTEKRLNITEFSLIQILNDEGKFSADLYLAIDQSGMIGDPGDPATVSLRYDLSVLQDVGNGLYVESHRQRKIELSGSKKFEVISGIPLVSSNSIIQIRVYEYREQDNVATEGLVSKKELTVSNRDDPPRVTLTDSVPSRIAYNNVKFSWIGTYQNKFNPVIKYSYNLDDKGWSSQNSSWRSVEYFNLTEGSHRFVVRSYYQDSVSADVVANFFVDVSRPVINTDKVTVEKIYDDYGFVYAVNLKGAAGAVSDNSLNALTVNGNAVEFAEDGSFTASKLPVTVDGVNSYAIAAYDLVGNLTEKSIDVDNTLTDIMYPQVGQAILYTPVTMVGKFPAKINNKVDIYVRDPLSREGAAGDFTGWHKARINEDFTFFVEDLTVNPGTFEREAHSALEIAVVSKSGHIYAKTVDVFANEVTRPIDLTLSVHAAEGEQADTKVTITAAAKVPGISSWSIDFTGDGIYDDVVLMDDPATAGTHTWTHTYSTLGIVKPRVRAITRQGLYFSVEDSLIIHEKIREASNKAVVSPISLSTFRMDDYSQRLYVLAGEKGNHRVEVYEIGRNEAYVSNKLYQIQLTGMGIEYPVKILAVNANTLIIAENNAGVGIVHTLVADEFEAFTPDAKAKIILPGTVNDFDCDSSRLFITQSGTNAVTTVDLVNSIPKPSTLVSKTPEIQNGLPLGTKLGVSKDAYGILLSDYDHQRIVRLSDSLVPLEYRGEQGYGEGQFIKPAMVKSYQNRMFVYDEARKDIQFFDPDFKPITRLGYDATASAAANYLDASFMNGVVGISAFAREESNRLFYYAVILSATSNKLAVLRLPQWEEMRARTRNNKIIFLKDNEVFSAKPTGSDLSRLISSDSIPRINGSVDYPALSPDGKMIAFTSRAKLYDGSGLSTAGTTYAYDNLYMMNTDGTGLTRIPLSAVQGYEIERPQFNSNGTKLIFSAKPTGGTWQIYVYSFEVGSVQRLFTSDENARFPYYSPDDRFIAFVTDYDGDQDIQIYDTLNPSMRVAVTNNGARDSFPVWSVVYPGEIANPDLKIESKIAFVSDRLAHKGLYYVYLSRPSESDIRIVTKAGQQIANKPDDAAVELTTSATEGDYPSFTGDGTAVVYEHFDGTQDSLLRYSFQSGKALPVDLMKGCRRPAGMKNTVTRFAAEVVDGNTVHLKWNRYTDTDVFYTVRFKVNQDDKPYVEKRVFTQEETYLTGMEMGVDYLVQVAIEENGEDAAATQWTKVKIPEVAARPSFEIDANNPYLVHLKAWKPKDETDWGFSWIIDNQEVPVQTSADYVYEFSTSGTKTILLKAHNKANTATSISAPMSVKIVSDIKPTVEYVLANDRSYIELSAQKSLGQRIDWSSAVWTVTGPGLVPPQVVSGSKAIVNIAQFRNKINVNLRVTRLHVSGQATTDNLETNLVIDLDYTGTKIVITQEADEANPRLVTFSGSNSIGNINWREARWTVFRDGQSLYQVPGLSSFAYEFPETNAETRYSVSLSVPSMSDGKTFTANNIVAIGAVPLAPEVDYEIIELKNAQGAVQGAKIIFSAANSKGSNIDFAQAKWTVPVAGTYGEQPTQMGPTAVYNLFNVGSVSQVEVSLTLMRRGGTETATVTKTINIKGNQVAKPQLIVNPLTTASSNGTVCTLDVLSSTGPNIDWERTEWQFTTNIPGQAVSTQRGPTAKIEIPVTAENTVIDYSVTLHMFGETQPLVRNDSVRVNAGYIRPLISPTPVPGGDGNVFTFSVANTSGVNIDWERTTWYFYDGNETVTQKYGSLVTHAFVKRDKAMGYPVVVAMFFKNSAKPFYAYKSVDIEADKFIPLIQWDRADASAGTEVLFTAEGSTGANIDWSQAKWTFGDGSPSQYGATVGHKYAFSSTDVGYKVSLTLTRRLATGETETATTVNTVNLAKDVIKPVVKAKLYKDGYLVLSAEKSEGRGLLLDRSTWMFAGKGDSENVNISKQVGKSNSSSISLKNTYVIGGDSLVARFFSGTEIGYSRDSSSSSSLSTTDSFSNENNHVGMTARRWIGDYDIYAQRFETQKNITVTLIVYRLDPDGGMTGEQITVNVNLADAVKGVEY